MDEEAEVQDPGQSVKRTPEIIRARLEALRKGRPTIEKNITSLNIALHNAQKALEQHDRNIQALEQLLEFMTEDGTFKIPVDRIIDPKDPPVS